MFHAASSAEAIRAAVVCVVVAAFALVAALVVLVPERGKRTFADRFFRWAAGALALAFVLMFLAFAAAWALVGAGVIGG